MCKKCALPSQFGSARRQAISNAGLGGVPGIVFRSPTFAFLGRRTEEYGLSDRQLTDASDRAVDSRGVLVRTNDRFQHFWRRTRRVGIKVHHRAAHVTHRDGNREGGGSPPPLAAHPPPPTPL